MHKFVINSVVALAVMGAVAAVPVGAFAQDGPPPQQDQGRPGGPQRGGLDALAQRLSLSDEQRAQLQPIFDERRQKMQALRSSDQSPDQRRAEMKKIMEESDAKIQPILSADQWQKYQQMQQQMRQQRDHQGPPPQQ